MTDGKYFSMDGLRLFKKFYDDRLTNHCDERTDKPNGFIYVKNLVLKYLYSSENACIASFSYRIILLMLTVITWEVYSYYVHASL